MMNWKMLLKLTKNRAIFFGLILILFISCDQKKDEDYIVRVGDSFLTQSMVDDAIGESEGSKLFREEFIRKWIEKQLIYLSAINQGILISKEYSELIDDAKVEIANAIVIRSLVKKNIRDVSKNELEKYYVENISEFKLGAKRFVYSQISFSNKSVAKKFRRKLVSNNWKNVVEEFSNNNALIFLAQNNFEYIYNILPMRVRVVLGKLNANDVSGVIETSQGVFTILQLVKSYEKNEVPEFHEIERDIKKKYIANNRKEIYNNFLKQLYSEYSSEIER